jgi:hypothetical protein
LPIAYCLLPIAYCLLPIAYQTSDFRPSLLIFPYLEFSFKKSIVKKLSILTQIILCFQVISAQSVNENFKPYEQSLPGSSLQFKMVPVRGGSFLMGSPVKEKKKEADETPQRKITISPFWMAAYEVSRDAFDVFYKDETIAQNSEVDAVTRPSSQYIDFSLGMGKEGGYPVNSLSQYAVGCIQRPVFFTGCQPKRNGNMPVVQEVLLLIFLAMILWSWVNTHGTKKIAVINFKNQD